MNCKILIAIISLLPFVHVHAQDKAGAPYDLPRVGSELDLNEIRYFQLFPQLEQDDLMDEAAVLLTSAGLDSVRFQLDATEGTERYRKSIVISHDAAEVLAILLRDFEDILMGHTPSTFFASKFVPDSLRMAGLELWTAKVLPAFWSELPYEIKEATLDVALYDGTRIAGKLMGITNHRLLLWRGINQWHPESTRDSLEAIPHERILSITAHSEERVSVGLFGLLLGAFLPHAGDHNYRGSMEFWSILAGPTVGAFGFLVPMEHPLHSDFSMDSSTELSGLLFLQHHYPGRGFPPEIPRMFSIGDTELFLTHPADKLPYINRLRFSMTRPTHAFSIGYEANWFTGTHFYFFRLLAALQYNWWPEFLQRRTAGAGGYLRSGLDFRGMTYAETGLAGRGGMLEFSAGIRYISMPEVMDESWSEVHLNTANGFSGTLYSSFSVSYTIYHVQLRLHTLYQLTPSVVRSHYMYDEQRPGRFFSGTTETGEPLTAIGFSTQLRF
ncbi:hypothetical protein KQI65_15705 [bacterium]|nr:hypothetical protein [bacterium]